MIAAAEAGTSWDEWTAIGTLILAGVTLLAVAVTVAITAIDRKAAERQLSEERDRAAKELTEQRKQSESEQTARRDAEQYAAACAVRVDLGEGSAGKLMRLLVSIANRGPYTISQVEARFSFHGTPLASHRASKRISTGPEDRPPLFARFGYVPADEPSMRDTLTTYDVRPSVRERHCRPKTGDQPTCDCAMG